MNKKLENSLNKQINKEFYSAYLYLSMRAYFEAQNLSGFAHWMRVQTKEETAHAFKIFDFLNSLGIRVKLEAISRPKVDFVSPLEVFEYTLRHEKKVTGMIDKLNNLAFELKDNTAVVFLQWFVKEQVEEEKNAKVILENLRRIKQDSAALFKLDRKLAKRK